VTFRVSKYYNNKISHDSGTIWSGVKFRTKLIVFEKYQNLTFVPLHKNSPKRKHIVNYAEIDNYYEIE